MSNFRFLRRLRSNARSEECAHVALVHPVEPTSTGCQPCIAAGDTWVHLRACLTCGQVGCCDESRNKHATKHYLATAHPLIQSLEPEENWWWCFVDEVMVSD